MNFIEWLQKLIEELDEDKLGDFVAQKAFEGLKLGFKTASEDLNLDSIMTPDKDAIMSIGIRARAISEGTIGRAKGVLAHKGGALEQEVRAMMEEGMSQNAAIGEIQGRMKELFDEGFKDWEIKRLVRDQFLVATKEGRRAGWQRKGVRWRMWKAHFDRYTGEDSKRMDGQITGINEPYTDPKAGEKYMIPHMRPNDRCYEAPLFELPKEIEYRGELMYGR